MTGATGGAALRTDLDTRGEVPWALGGVRRSLVVAWREMAFDEKLGSVAEAAVDGDTLGCADARVWGASFSTISSWLTRGTAGLSGAGAP